MITINLNKAKEIKKENLRQERKPLLEALDVQFMRSLEKGEDVSEIAAEKQKLRDVTKLCDTVESVEELKQISINT